mgnify:CR=1 FL=1
MAEVMELAQISLTAEDFDQAFMASLRRYGFAALIHHPLDDGRVQRIYEAWRAFFGSGAASAYAMDPEAQDGYFSPDQAESARGFRQRDYKEYFQYYPWGRCYHSTFFRPSYGMTRNILDWLKAINCSRSLDCISLHTANVSNGYTVSQ